MVLHLIIFVLGIIFFFHGLGLLRKKRAIENIPASTVRGLAMGLVEITGKAKKTKTLQAPMTGTECAFYRYTVDRLQRSGRSNIWVQIAQDDSILSPFLVDDGTGQIMVLAKGAEILMPAKFTFMTGLGKALPNNLVNFIEKNDLRNSGSALRFNEWHIKYDETIFVMGTAQKNSAQPAEIKASEQGDAADVIITKDNNQIFIISEKSQANLIKSFSWDTLLFILGGAALSLYALALWLIWEK